MARSDGEPQRGRHVPVKLQVPIDPGFREQYAAFAEIADEQGLPHSEAVKTLVARFVDDKQLRQQVITSCRSEMALRRQAANRARSASARQRHQAEE